MRVRLLPILLMVLVSQDVSAQEVKALQRDYLQVFDSNGKLVGHAPATGSGPYGVRVVVGFTTSAAQRFPDAIVLPLVWIGSTQELQRYDWADGRLLWESLDCTGQPYVLAPILDPTGLRIGAVMDGNLLYVSAADPAIERKTFSSSKYRFQGCTTIGDVEWAVAAHSSGVDLDTVWLTPFAAR